MQAEIRKLLLLKNKIEIIALITKLVTLSTKTFILSVRVLQITAVLTESLVKGGKGAIVNQMCHSWTESHLKLRLQSLSEAWIFVIFAIHVNCDQGVVSKTVDCKW